MHLFDENDKLTKFENTTEIIDKFISVRREIYVKRKEYQITALEREALVLSNKARFISELLNDTLDLRRKKRADVTEILTNSNYDIVDNDEDYKYLVKMPMDTVTEENVAKLMTDKETKLNEIKTLKATSIEQLWLNELGILKSQYAEYTKERETLLSGKTSNKTNVKKLNKKVGK